MQGPHSLEDALEGLLQEFRRLRTAGEDYGAVKSLAEIWHCLPAVPERSREAWRSIVEREFRSADLASTAVTRLRADLQRIRRILAVPGQLNDDEVTLLLTVRVQIDLVYELLEQMGSAHRGFQTEDVDARLQELASCGPDANLFRACMQEMSERWGLPIRSRWLVPPSGADWAIRR